MKGLSKEATVKFDIVSGSNRTVNFDIYKGTDIYAVGGTYGYGINPTQNGTCATTTSTGSEFVSSNATCSAGTPSTPYFSGSQFTIAAGSATSYSRASEVASQNIAVASPNQPLGGFAFDVKGEVIQVQQHVFFFDYTANATDNGELLTSVRMVDKNGVVVAGPVDAVNVGGGQQKVTFTDLVSYPTGRNVYTLQGQLPSTISNGQTIVASTTPSTNWTNVTGASTGDTVSLSSLGLVTGNTMTIKTGSIVVSIAGTPAAQTMVAGVTGATVAALNFDATQSGEDIRFNSQKFDYTDALTPSGTDVTNCFAYDGATRLNDTAVNPTTNSTGYTFTFNTVLTVTKGTVKTVTIKCDLPAALTGGSFSWGFVSGEMAQGTGIASSNAISPTGTDNAGNAMTVAGAGTLTVALDASAPSAKVVAVGTGGVTGQTLNALRFSGTNEDMRLDRVALQLSGGSGSSSPNNITQVTLWDGATQVGTAIFAGSRFATSTLTGTVVIPANGSKTLTVKGDLPGISLNSAGTAGARLMVDYDNDDSTGTRAVGLSSGTTINRTSSSDTSVVGSYTHRSMPSVTYVVAGGALTNGTQPLLTVTVAADTKGDVTMRKLVFGVATTSAQLVSPTFVGPNGAVSSVSLAADGLTITATFDPTSADAVIPAGGSKTFTLGATVSGLTGSTAGVVSLNLEADATVTGSPAQAGSVTPSNVVWSPQSTTTAQTTSTYDFFNGYGLGGCFAVSGIGQDCLAVSKAQ
jgi:hypothetical protein